MPGVTGIAVAKRPRYAALPALRFQEKISSAENLNALLRLLSQSIHILARGMASAQGIHELSRLIRSMSPSLEAEIYVFAHIPKEAPESDSRKSRWLMQEAITQADMLFREHEGWTIIIPQSLADKLGLDFTFPCKKVTLNVHSSLDAVGFLAKITTRLADNLGIGINPVSGYFHDHLFIPLGKEDLALDELKAMAADEQV